MKLYKITASGAAMPNRVKWAGTQANAKTTAALMRVEWQEWGVKTTIEDVDFPTDKPGLLAYLNEHFTLDNT